MGYAYHWSGSETTGPNSPLSGPGYTLTWTISDYLEKTNYQLDKLILGCPYFGFEWASSANTPGSNTLEVGNAKFYSEIEGLALSYGKLWHQSSQTPWYTYNNTGWNQGWYDDSLSLSLKYDFALYISDNHIIEYYNNKENDDEKDYFNHAGVYCIYL